MAAELVGGALLSAILDVLVLKLASPELINFFKDNQIVVKLLEKLNISLWSANALLNDAENKQIADGNIKNWVDKLNEVLNDVDNVMDKINTKAMQHNIKVKKRQQPRWCKRDKFLTKLRPNDPSISYDKEMKQRIESLIDTLKFLLDQKDCLGLKEGVQNKRLERSPAPLIGDPSGVYGRDDDKEAVIKLLFSENVSEEISVIPIVGMGGVGKTTLAQLVYDDARVKDHFEHRAWVTVSDDFDVLRLARLTFEGLSDRRCEVGELGKLRDELESLLRGKKFLLVLDDVWNEKYSLWNALKSYFQFGENGSKIIVTTRSEEIGSMVGSVPSHLLATMSDEDCWQLFTKHAFHNVDHGVRKDLEKVGRAIVEKCKGLPLAVMSLAGLLCSISDPKEWEEILKSDVWELHRKGNDEILPSLWLSYSYLPSRLKRCFSYCSIFPKDFEYKKRKIILLWMAEGLLQGENMEAVGEEYLKALTSRSLIQRSARDESSFVMHDLDESSFVMHDLVHDLATFVSGKGFCIRLGTEDNGYLSGLTNKTRHLLYEYDVLYPWRFQGLSKETCLRTVLPLSSTSFDHSCNDFCRLVKKFGCLRVLCLSDHAIKKLPNSISKLELLRYLDLSTTWIKSLPDSVCSLFNLQTLLLRSCCLLTRLPVNMGQLVNLRHLDIFDTESLRKMPLRGWNLRGLRTLNKLVLNDRPTETQLSDLSKLKELKRLDIVEYLGEDFSNWASDYFPNTTEVSLSYSKHLYKLPSLGKLLSLRVLRMSRLHRVKEMGSSFYGTSVAFTSLEILDIYEMDELRIWSFDDGAFPQLQELRIHDCPKLNSLSPRCLPSLKELFILRCRKMETLLSSGFPSLEKMRIEDCPRLEFSGLPLPPRLNYMWIENCKKVFPQSGQWGLEALEGLQINGFEEEEMKAGSFPSTLVELSIVNAPNLRSLDGGEGFRHLVSLKDLEIRRCPKLRSLPEDLPASIEEFRVYKCNVLKPRLQRRTGEEWHRISHIPIISVDYENI